MSRGQISDSWYGRDFERFRAMDSLQSERIGIAEECGKVATTIKGEMVKISEGEYQLKLPPSTEDSQTKL